VTYAKRPIAWRRGPDPVHAAYEAELDGRRLALSVGDFPAEPLYTLFVDGERVETFDGWPPAWVR
jgi:hypothetical protein